MGEKFMSKKFGLALGAGGSRGVAHVGVLRALEEEGIKPEFIAGSSMGAVVGACYANGMSCENMLEAVLKIKTAHLVDLGAASIKRLGFFKGNKMYDLLLKNIGDISFEDLKIPFRCVASDMLSGRSVTLSSGNLVKAVRASSSIPAIFRPVRMDNMLLIDGGVLCRVPTQQVWEMGAEAVLAVDVLGNTGDSVKNVRNLATLVFRVYDMMDYNANEMKKQLTAKKGELWITPDMNGMNQYSAKGIDKAYEYGYNETKAHMAQIKKLLQIK